ncbi:hypothetical protein DP49_5707 [Burkholderia pseudomallei]|nr:hypothetical protein DP49_5707 [Burkholderia pseudomallei]
MRGYVRCFRGLLQLPSRRTLGTSSHNLEQLITVFATRQPVTNLICGA